MKFLVLIMVHYQLGVNEKGIICKKNLQTPCNVIWYRHEQNIEQHEHEFS